MNEIKKNKYWRIVLTISKCLRHSSILYMSVGGGGSSTRTANFSDYNCTGACTNVFSLPRLHCGTFIMIVAPYAPIYRSDCIACHKLVKCVYAGATCEDAVTPSTAVQVRKCNLAVRPATCDTQNATKPNAAQPPHGHKCSVEVMA